MSLGGERDGEGGWREEEGEGLRGGRGEVGMREDGEGGGWGGDWGSEERKVTRSREKGYGQQN